MTVLGIDGQYNTLLGVMNQARHGRWKEDNSELANALHAMLTVTCCSGMLHVEPRPSERSEYLALALKNAVHRQGTYKTRMICSDSQRLWTTRGCTPTSLPWNVCQQTSSTSPSKPRTPRERSRHSYRLPCAGALENYGMALTMACHTTASTRQCQGTLQSRRSCTRNQCVLNKNRERYLDELVQGCPLSQY